LSETCGRVLAAAKQGDLGELLALIQQGFAVDAACNTDGETALHAAAEHGHVGVVKTLVKQGANVDATTKSGDTPLKLAASKGHVEVATALLGAHASVDAANANGGRPLHVAVRAECVPMMELLLDAGADVDARTNMGYAPLHLATLMQATQPVSVLLSRGAIVDLPCSKGHTALHYACGQGKTEMVQQLVQAGAAVNARSNTGATALQFASEAGHVEVVQQLVAAGAAVNSSNWRVTTALHTASAAGKLGVVVLLLGSGAHPTIKDANGALALHIAAQQGHAGVVASLLQAAPGLVNATEAKGFTPLNLASRKGSMEVLQLLLAAGADPGAAALDGATALHGAATFGHNLFLQQLVAALAAGQGSGGLDAEFMGLTPLACAVEGRKMGCVEVLLQAGADPERLYGAAAKVPDGPSMEGATLLHRAVAGRFQAAVPLLATPANMCRLWRGKTPLHLAVSSIEAIDWLRHVLVAAGEGDMDMGGSIYSIIKALVEAGSPAGLPDADGNTALALAAGSRDILLVELVMPAMVRNECKRYKQLLQVEEGRQQQQQQQQDAGAVRAGIVDGVYALLVATAAAKKAGPPAESYVEAADPAAADPADHPPPQAGDPPAPNEGGPALPPGGGVPSVSAAFGDFLASPKYVLKCLEVVLGELGQAEAASMFQLLLLRALGSGGAGAGSPFHWLVYEVLHSGGWPEVEEQMVYRWRAASRLRGLLGQALPQQAAAGGQAAADLRAQAMAVAATAKQQPVVQLLDHLAGLQVAVTLQEEMGQEQEGGQAADAEERMKGLLETLHRCWGAAQQQVLIQMQQEVKDAVMGGVMAWEQAGGRGRG
jgi:ankyrin repeat protein